MMAAEQRYQPRDPGPPPEPPVVAPAIPIRIAPHDLHAEQAVLSACLLDAAICARLAPTLESDAFMSDAHRVVFDAVRDLLERGEPIDVVQVGAWLRERELIQRAGGSKYLGELVEATPSLAHAEKHAAIVRALKQRRRLIAACQRIQAEGYGAVDDDWIAESLNEIRAISEAGPRASSWDWTDGCDFGAELPPIPWVVSGLELAPGLPSMLAGYGYSGKTMAAQSIAIAVASGTTLWERFPVRQGRVRHIDYEQGRRLTHERYQRLARAAGVELARGALSFVSLPREKLDQAATEQLLLRELEGITLAVIDSYRAGAPSTDENSSEARVPLDMLGRVSEQTGCCVLVIHHARKSSEQDGDARQILRGSSALFDACQAIWTFSAKKDEPTLASCAKARLTGRQFPDFLLRTQDVADEQAIDLRWGLRMVLEQVLSEQQKVERDQHQFEDVVLIHLRKNPGLSGRAIAQLVRKRPATVYATLELLERGGAAKKITGTKKEGERWYAVAKSDIHIPGQEVAHAG